MLVIVEIGLSVVLLMAATLLTRSLVVLGRSESGVRQDHVLTLKLNLVVTPSVSATRQAAALDRVLEAVGGVPGVQSVAATSSLPPHVSQMHTTITTPARASAGEPEIAVEVIAVSSALFSTLGVPVLHGRAIAASGPADGPPTLVLSDTAARRLFPGQNAVGQRLALGGRDPQQRDAEIVGVVGDVKYSGLDAPPDGAVYLPYAQRAFQVMYLVVQTRGEAAPIAKAVRTAIAKIEPLVAVSGVRSLAELDLEAAAEPRFVQRSLSEWPAWRSSWPPLACTA